MRREIFSKQYTNTSDFIIKLHCEEAKPECRTIFVEYGYIDACDYHKDRTETYYIALPFVQYYFWQEIYPTGVPGRRVFGMSFSNRPVESLTDKVFYPTLPNLGYHGIPCGLHPHDIKQGIDVFWNSPFKLNDQRDEYDGIYYLKRSLETFGRWQEQTKKNPEFVLSVNWPMESPLLIRLGQEFSYVSKYYSG